MQKKTILNYFKQGFVTANQSLDLWVIGYLLLFVNFVLVRPQNLFLRIIVFFLIMFLFLLSFAFNFSLPLFLTKRKEKKLSYHEVCKTTLENAKRLALPFFVSIVLLTILLTIFMVVFARLFDFNQKINFVLILIPVLSSFFTFTSIFFSIEGNGFNESLKKSFFFSLKNIPYLLCVIFFQLTTQFLTHPLVTNFSWGKYLYSAINIYMGLFLVATSLIYYQNNQKTKRNS